MNQTDKVLIDTNICLDVLLGREKHRVYSEQILSACETNTILGFVCSLSYSNIFYFLNKKFSRSRAYEALVYLERTADIASVTDRMIKKAIQDRWKDFEDAIQYHSALESECDAIITRNTSDFKKSEIPVFTAYGYLNK